MYKTKLTESPSYKTKLVLYEGDSVNAINLVLYEGDSVNSVTESPSIWSYTRAIQSIWSLNCPRIRTN
jgi:hypothetical protein